MGDSNKKKGVQSDTDQIVDMDVDKIIADTMRGIYEEMEQSELEDSKKKESYGNERADREAQKEKTDRKKESAVRTNNENNKEKTPDQEQKEKRTKKDVAAKESETYRKDSKDTDAGDSDDGVFFTDCVGAVSAEGTVEEKPASSVQKKRRKKKPPVISEIKEKEEVEEELDGWDDLEDDFDEASRDKRPKSRIMKGFLIVLGSILGILIAAYLGASVFFMSHFYVNSTINGINFSGKTVSEVEEYMSSQVKGYSLTIQEHDGVTEKISGSEISLKYEKSDDVQKAMENQNAFLWPKAFFEKKSAEVTIEVSYDDEALKNRIATLACVTGEQTDSVSASPKFDGNTFVIEPEVIGSKVDTEKLHTLIEEYVSGFKDTLDMVETDCYPVPKYTSESAEVQAACDAANKFCTASITYSMNPDVVVDKAVINTWVVIDENMGVTLNQDAIKAYMAEFGKTYDTVGKTRSITTPTGKVAEVSGGSYGWSVDEATEIQNLINSINAGEVVTREPAYEQTAASRDQADWGTTYAEVDLTEQHMWYISNGSVVFEADVVTGLPTPDKETPQGVWSCLERKQDKTLVGAVQADGLPEYETPVAFWMRVTWTGVGFHTATWQPYFGGTRYQTNGSHGCINMSYSDSETLYWTIQVGDPVIIHY